MLKNYYSQAFSNLGGTIRVYRKRPFSHNKLVIIISCLLLISILSFTFSWYVRNDHEYVQLVEIYSVSAEKNISDAFSYSESIKIKKSRKMCDVKMFLTFISLSLVLLWQLFYLFCSSIVINTVIVTAGNFEP